MQRLKAWVPESAVTPTISSGNLFNALTAVYRWSLCPRSSCWQLELIVHHGGMEALVRCDPASHIWLGEHGTIEDVMVSHLCAF